MSSSVQVHSSQTIPATQVMAMRLINGILTQDEEVLVKLTSPNITVTSITNGGEKKVHHGQKEYLEVIHDMWTKLVDYKYGAFAYMQFTPDFGTLSFTQVCIAKGEDGHPNRISLGQGTQAFGFDGPCITSIDVVENRSILEENEVENQIAQMNQQRLQEVAKTIVKTDQQQDKILAQVPSSTGSWGSCILM